MAPTRISLAAPTAARANGGRVTSIDNSDLDYVGGRVERPTRIREFVLMLGGRGGSDAVRIAANVLVEAGYSPVATVDPEEAIADMRRFAFDALVVTAQMAPTLRDRVIGEYRALRPGGKVIELEEAPRLLLESVNRALAG